MSFFSRMGTEPHKFTIELIIDKLSLQTKDPSLPLCVKLIRGSKISKTDTETLNSKGVASFSNKTLICVATLYKKKDKYLKKEARLAVFQSNKGIETEIGRVDFDLANYVKSGEFKDSEQWPLQKCTDKKATMTVKIHTIYLKDIAGDQAAQDLSVSKNSEASEHSDNQPPTKAPAGKLNAKPGAAAKKPTSDQDSEESSEEESSEEESEEESERKQPKKPNQATSKPNNSAKPASAANKANNKKPAESEESSEEQSESSEDDSPATKSVNKVTTPTNAGKQPSKPATTATKSPRNNKNKNSDSEEESEEESEDSSNGKAAAAANRKVQFNSRELGSTNPKDSVVSTANNPKSSLKPNSPTSGPIKWADIFHCTLEQAMSLNPKASTAEIPYILDVLLNWIDRAGCTTEGIFKAAPAPEQRDKLIKLIESGDFKLFESKSDKSSAVDALAVAGVLKHFLANLSVAVIPPEISTECIEIGKRDIEGDEKGAYSDDEEEEKGGNSAGTVREALSRVLPKVPPLNRRVLLRIISSIKKLSSPEIIKRNKMNLHSLAVVFAPALLRINKEGKEAYELFMESQYNVKFLEHLVKYSQLLSTSSTAATTSATAVTSQKPVANNAKKPAASSDESEEDSADEESEEEKPKQQPPVNKPASAAPTGPKIPAGAQMTPLMMAAQIAADKKAALAAQNAKIPPKAADSYKSSEDSEDSEAEIKPTATKSAPNNSGKDDFAAQISSLTADLAKLQLENETLRKGPGGAKSPSNNSAESKKQIEKLTKEKEAAERETKLVNEKLGKVKKELEESRKKHEEELKKLKSAPLASNSSQKLSGKEKDIEINSLRGEVDSAKAEQRKLQGETKALQIELEELKQESGEQLHSLAAQKDSFAQQVDSLKAENDSLRARIMKFDELNLSQKELNAAKKNKDKNIQQFTLLQAYETAQKRIEFLQTAIKESDETLIQARQTWAVTNKVLQDLNDKLQAELNLANEHKHERNSGLSEEQQDLQATEKKLIKLNKKYNALAENYNILELEMTKTKVQLNQAKQTILQLQDENKKTNNQLLDTGIALKTIAADNFELKEFIRLNTKGKKPNAKLAEKQTASINQTNNTTVSSDINVSGSSPKNDNFQ
jgi:hypothetical protein